MREIFNKSIESITLSDVQAVIGWPESLVVEYKEQLPGRDGRLDAWLTGGKIETYAKEKLFKEVVALANTSGGHVVLGVAETDDKPPCAARLAPIPRCVDLAERLEQAAQSIDPPIPLLLVRGIPTSDDGSGIVLFRVPQSSRAPHRSIDKDCYVRRGTSSVPVNMREINDMILLNDTRASRVDSAFGRCDTEFSELMNSLPPEPRAMFRLSAVPVGTSFDLGRVYGRTGLLEVNDRHRIAVEGRHASAIAWRLPTNGRPIVRGVRYLGSHEGDLTYIDIYSDGRISAGFCIGARDEKSRLYMGWVLGYLIVLLLTVDRVRIAGGAPDCEYGIECFFSGSPALTVADLANEFSHTGDLGSIDRPLLLPRTSFGPISDINDTLGAVYTDVCDAMGLRYTDARSVKLAR
ncbi:MAG TPA: hypothetical protein DDZ81_20155 [Acetobacteraceae bacterium]|jgi:hypothetical protein|nr:hypothetical protein [Acetobacteraceae bacterium]